MKILIVCSGNTLTGRFRFEVEQSIIYEQTEACKKLGVEFDIFLITGKGLRGYLKNLKALVRKIRSSRCDLVHAHNGLSGLLAIMQFMKPVVVTFHGCDINNPKTVWFSTMANCFAKWRIFVSKSLYESIKFRPSKNFNIIPCGINFDVFYPVSKIEARRKLGLDKVKKYALFSSDFDNGVKNYGLAKAAIDQYRGNLELLELKNRTRDEVNLLLNAVDLLLVTSFSEGSPQVVKEAMATNCPVVSTDVGDVRKVIRGVEGCYLASFEPEDVAAKINDALCLGRRTSGRKKIKYLDNRVIARQIREVYERVSGKSVECVDAPMILELK